MVNKVILIGYTGKDPDIRHFEGGRCVASLSLATTETHKDRDGNRIDQTEWHNLVFWNKLAEIVEKYIQKGSKIYIEGKLKTRAWEDDSGVRRYTTEVYVDTLNMLSPKKDQGNEYPETDINTVETPF